MAKNQRVNIELDTAQLDRWFAAVRSGDAENALTQALTEEMQIVFRQSQREVPVRTGALKGSGRIDGPRHTGPGQVTVEVGYGGAASAYARVQHNDRSLRHPGGGKAGFVSDPVLERTKTLRRNLSTRMERILKR